MNIVPKEDSYAERRMLFKTIWDTTKHINKGADKVDKPKVIKTLRLDVEEKSEAIRVKRDREKNLKHACNKIITICKREANEVQSGSDTCKKIKKLKHHRKRNRKSSRLSQICEPRANIPTLEKMYDDLDSDYDEFMSRNNSATKLMTTTLSKALIKGFQRAPYTSKGFVTGELSQNKEGTIKKTIRKGTMQIKKYPEHKTHPITVTTLEWPEPLSR